MIELLCLFMKTKYRKIVESMVNVFCYQQRGAVMEHNHSLCSTPKSKVHLFSSASLVLFYR